MKFGSIAAVAVLATGFGAVIVPGSVADAAPTTLIVGNSHTCTGTYPTISAAVAAAVPGDIIRVCAGTYNETVNVDVPGLTFIGAKNGKKGTAARAARAAKESVVSSVDGDFLLGSAAENTTISGFTLEGAGSPTVNHDAIEAFAGSSGLQVTDDVIVNNGNGINLQNPDGSKPAAITANYIWNNNSEGDPGTNGETGTGVFISNGPANATSISHNIFGEDSQTAINFAGGGSPSVGLVVASNRSLNDATFVVAINSTNATIQNNKITVSGAVPGGNGTGILDFGGNTGLSILRNIMNSNAAVSSAVGLATYAGSASTGTTVIANTIVGWNNGVSVAAGYTSALVTLNRVSHNAVVGISFASGTDGNVISHNRVSSDGTPSLDCRDLSAGSLTAGTANTWLKNTGADANSTPSAIC